jgi:hypothetical protein
VVPPQQGPENALDEESVIELERQVLAAVCQESNEGSVRDSARKLLAGYEWHDAAHQAVFGIVMKFAGAPAEALREQLPAYLTLRGFPDFDFDSLFYVRLPPNAETEERMRMLRGIARTSLRAPVERPLG